MIGSFRHVLTSFSWGRSTRVAVALILAVAACLLALPATASAKVDKKHAKPYAAKIKAISTFEKGHRESYNGYEEGLVLFAEEMKPLIGSPDPYDQIHLTELVVASDEAYRSYDMTIKGGNEVYLTLVQALYPQCKGWFSRPADKTRFHTLTTRLTVGVSQSNLAFYALSESYKALSKQDMPGAQAFNNLAIEGVTKAEPKIDEGLAGLRALQR